MEIKKCIEKGLVQPTVSGWEKFLWGIKMKKIAALLFCITLFCFLQFGQDVRVNSSIRKSGRDGTEEYLSITANRIFITDKEKFAQEMIERRIENSYKEIYFTEQYPKAIEVDVYLNWLTWKMKRKSFSVVYEYDGDEGYSFNCSKISCIH